jgi:hypothetical protein
MLACWLRSMILVSLVWCAGCSRDEEIAERESSNLKPLAVYYGRFIGAHQGKSPANETELKEFIRKQPAEDLEAMGVRDVESLFVSSRDKKPYRFNFSPKETQPGQIVVFAWEQDGIEGKRYVGGTLGQIEEVDATRFGELVASP